MYTVRALSEAQFFALKNDWGQLLSRSDADPLFMSWPWQASWWEVWGHKLQLKLLLLAVYDDAGRLIALAPLYFSRYRTPIGWDLKRLHIIGNAWKLGPTVRTEYIGCICDTQHKPQALEALSDYLKGEAWDELILADALGSEIESWAQALGKQVNVTCHVRSEAQGVAVDTRGGYDEWLTSLGKNTRLKVYNRRSLFEGQLGGEFQAWEDPGAFLELLNNFHVARWGKPCFDQDAVRFHQLLLDRLTDNQRAQLSVLQSDGKILSVLYDIRAGDRVYNLQAGFLEEFHPKISVGTLHLGYCIEAAFRCMDVASYDLLAGSGKNTFYKSHFKGQTVRFTTVEYVRSSVLKMAYGARGYLPQGLVSSVNRFFRL
ncbi:hypothetical protein DOQ08_00828 [Marinobacter litoralis]|uniref:BioF2-like acetyltransferase domain-containing protein n=1 Tax=Marinobacter litoralis TaxID=187981 RepID=A0A3M2RLB9_9GAMM|nr:GNAT family N-acetyltransferase [Marinobacter litoralis]RMJ06143.1 hypothetical protein DOQ08_00828 [Marinobacter litoralis]